MITQNTVLLELFDAHIKAEQSCGDATPSVYRIHNALAKAVMSHIADDWHKSKLAHESGKRACYLSAEFLVGRAVYNNLLCLGLTEDADRILRQYGACLADLEEIEDAALGNGGLGRLAACFLDSAATHNLPLAGYGIRYRYGLFKQRFVDGMQHEEADDWTRHGDPWSVRREEDAVSVAFADQTVRAVPYDMPILGYGTSNVGTLRLWQAEPLERFDFALFNAQRYDEASRSKNRAEDISRVLYPNDDTLAGKRLRLKQEYFFSSASIADLMRTHKRLHGDDWSRFAELYAVQLNDTHPVLAIPELVRRLMDMEELSFDDAFAVAQSVFHYTNHTIMAEALEKWSAALVRSVLPRVYQVIRLIDRRLKKDFAKRGMEKEQVRSMAVVDGNTIHMARLAVYASAHTNGVAQIHTQLLTQREMADWYAIFPERFQNKTNGITQRRWLALCNPALAKLITEILGSDRWITDLSALKELERFAEDEQVLRRFIDIKQENKRRLAEHIRRYEGVDLNPDAIFDIQIKRLHEYKRQLLNALAILDIYYGILDGRITDFHPTVFLFGAKAAPGYKRAKAIIKFINVIARVINGDERLNGRMKVVFVHNYNVSYAEKLVCAADISEQISTAGTEASGTGNMKFMLNGTVTLGTYDGANVEIVREAGEQNNFIFGRRVEELAQMKDSYDPMALYNENTRIRRVMDTLVDGTFDDGGTGGFAELHDALLKGASWHKPDHYYLLEDFTSYVDTRLAANSRYQDTLAFAKMSWLNLCNAGMFSSDRTIADYAQNIWGIAPVSV